MAPRDLRGSCFAARIGGRTWKDAKLPGELNSTPWCIASHAVDPSILFVCTNFGQLFRSMDGGDTWQKLKREFGEVRAVMLAPMRG
jgi:photosystem II stability/assembly factor-like uncharacterized protein